MNTNTNTADTGKPLNKHELPMHIKEMILPPVGTQLGMGNKLFKVTYRNVGKLRFTAEFVGELDAEKPEQAQAQGQGQGPGQIVGPGAEPELERDPGGLIITPAEARRQGLIL